MLQLVIPQGKVSMGVETRTTSILTPLPQEVFDDLQHAFEVEVMDKRAPVPGWQRPDPIRLLFGTPDKAEFWTGLLPQVQEALETRGYAVKLYDGRERPHIDADGIERRIEEAQELVTRAKGGPMLPYAVNAIRNCTRNPWCSIEIATSGRKSICMASLIYVMDEPTILVTDSVELMKQLRREVSLVLGEDNVGVIGAGLYEPKRFTIAIIDSLVNKPAILKKVKVLVVDEAHLAGAATFRHAIHYSDATYRWGFSGTYIRMRSEMNLLYAATGPCVQRVTSSDLIRLGISSRPFITLVKMPDDEETTGFDPNEPVEDDLAKYEAMYRVKIVRNRPRNLLGCAYARHHVQEGRKVIMFVARIEHGEILRCILTDEMKLDADSVVFVHGESGEFARQAALDDLESGRISVLVCSKIFEKGVDVPSVGAGVNLKGEYTETGCRQSLGRGLRPDDATGNEFHLLDFIDPAPASLRAHSRNRKRIYRSEDEWRTSDVGAQELANELRIDASCFNQAQARTGRHRPPAKHLRTLWA